MQNSCTGAAEPLYEDCTNVTTVTHVTFVKVYVTDVTMVTSGDVHTTGRKQDTVLLVTLADSCTFIYESLFEWVHYRG